MNRFQGPPAELLATSHPVDDRVYEASLERNKIYAVLADDDAERDGDLRVVDESREDYLFAADRFVAIDVPAAVKASLLKQA